MSLCILVATMKTGRRRVFVYLPAIVLVVLLLKYYRVFILGRANYFGNFEKSELTNFIDFPCLPGIRPTEGLLQHGKCVRTLAPLNFDQPDTLMEGCTYLHAGKDTPICTYDPSNDLISEFIHRQGSWEIEFVDIMIDAMNKTPRMMLFDVGANIGVYCISAALFNKKVVCLDANYENMRKIAKSLYLGQLTANATLIWNAVSNKHETIKFHVAKGNYGSSRIADLKKWHYETEANLAVNSIKLNDLQDYSGFTNRPVFMKLDVEAHELFVLTGADEFFKKVDVRIVQVELAEPDTKFEVIELFEKYGFLPYLDPLGEQRLYKPDAFITWPTDMYFVRRPFSLETQGSHSRKIHRSILVKHNL